MSETKKIISFPRMGNIDIPIKSILETMGASVLIPPANSKETLSIGTRYSCETVCLPYKLNLGNYIQALEAGANTLIMFQAPGTCRLGNYAAMAELKLRELGYDFEMIVFDLYKGKFLEIAKKFSQACGNTNITKSIFGIKLGLEKFDALDKIERKLFYLRPREIKKGEAERIYCTGRKNIDAARSVNEVRQSVEITRTKFDGISLNKDKEILKVYLTGEFFVLLDPFTNMEIEKELGNLGVEVDRQVMLSDWTNQTLIPKFLRKNETHRDRAVRIAKKYMTRTVGGDCIESLGDAVHAASHAIDGVVHIGPFNCNPEVVSQNILPQISYNENIPVISLIMDEQTAKAGLKTRLEAFVDLIRRNKRKTLCTSY